VARLVALAAQLLAATTGCGKVLGVDEYTVGEPPVDNPCGPLQAWTGAAGKPCVDVGVPASACGDGFTSDRKGGCDPKLGQAVCPDGQFATPGSGCGRLSNCDATSAWTDPIHSPVKSYVQQGAKNGKGTKDQPFGTIEEALRALQALQDGKPVPAVLKEGPDGTVPEILIGSSDTPYQVNLDVTFPVRLQGSCAELTHLVARDPNKPVVTFSSGATMSAPCVFGRACRILTGLQIEGGSAGVLVDGVDAVGIYAVRITKTDGPGVLANDAKPASPEGASPKTKVYLGSSDAESSLLIEGALGAGVLSYGADLVVASAMIRRTRAPDRGKDSGGICIRPSPWVPTLAEGDVPAGAWDPRAVVRPSLTMTRTVLEDNAGAGLFVVGADATVTETLIRATGTPDVPEQRVGVDVSEHSFGDVPATLTIKQSVVDGVSVEGIRSHNAAVSVENTVVRNIGGPTSPSPGAMRCLGSGIRARWDRPSDVTQSPPLIVKTSTVEHTHDTGILVEGAAALIEGSLVRDTAKDPCADGSPPRGSNESPGLGDGIGVYGHTSSGEIFAPASLDLSASRVEGSARAAVAVFGGPAVSSVAVASSVLAGSRGVVQGPKSPDAKLGHALCGATGSASCAVERAPLEPSLLGGGGCVPTDHTVCEAGCLLDSSNPSPTPLPGFRSWVLDHDEIAPAITNSDGCFQLEGLPQNAEVLVAVAKPVPLSAVPFDTTSWAKAYAPGVGLWTTGVVDGDPGRPLTIPGSAPLNVDPVYVTSARTEANVSTFDADFRTALPVAVFVCAAHPEALARGTDACRAGLAVDGVQVALEPGSGVGPLYLAGPPRKVPATTADVLGAIGLFFNVSPGQYQVHLSAQDPSKTLSCTFDTSHGPITGGKKAGDDPNTFQVVATAGQAMGLWAFCSLN
jgi:hypothetical protein